MQFTTVPPEITSALIHSGPGAESLIAAAAAWQQLGTTLEDTAESYAAALTSLDGTWHGPSSAQMLQAVEPYVTWLRGTAQQAQQVAVSAQTAAAAFNAVSASVVPTSQVLANRTRLAQLLATNMFGRNLPAIAQTEAQYQAMWANNAAAMNRYQATSAQATTLPQFSSPTSTTNPSALSTQAGASPAATTGTSAATTAATTSAAPAAGSGSGINLGISDPVTGYIGLANVYANQFVSSGFPINLLSYLAQSQSAQALQGVSSQIGQGVSEGEEALGGAAANLGGGAAGALGAIGQSGGGLGALGAAGLGEINTSAALGAAVPMGTLSAPPSAAPMLQAPVQLASAASPLSGGMSGMSMPPLMPPPISPGSGWRKRKAQKYDDIAIGAELKGKVMKPPPSAG
ncbi:PPE family protein [Mycobacterium cookii]|nr:PPE family protein [Mycobacterium cookii]MCV7328929.1 PPE family protein [Mycobacterium cookii]